MTDANEVFYTKTIYSTAGDIQTISANEYEQVCKYGGDCFEVIPDDRPIKLYFDTDIKYEGENMKSYDEGLVPELINIIQTHLRDCVYNFKTNPEFHFATSNSPSFIDFKTKKQLGKISIHTVISNIIAMKEQQGLMVKHLNILAVKFIENLEKYIGVGNKLFDESPYDPNRKIRSLYASKPNEKRPLVIYKGNFEGLVISSFIPHNAVMMPQIEKPKIEKKPEAPLAIKTVKTDNSKYNKLYFEKFLEEGLLDKYADTYDFWRNIGFILKYEFKQDGWELFKAFSALSHDYGDDKKYTEDDNRNQWDRWSENPEKPLTIATLIDIVKKDNKEKYTEIHKSITALKKAENKSNTKTNKTDYDLAKELYSNWGMNFVCSNITNNEWYKFNENAIWNYEQSGNEIRRIISNQFRDQYTKQIKILKQRLLQCKSDEECQSMREELGVCIAVEQRLGTTNDKKNIMTELREIAYKDNFTKDFNKQLGVLPLKNNQNINLNTNELTTRTIDDKFTYQCNATYCDLTKDDEDFIRKYFMDLFVGNPELVQCVIDIVKTMMAGYRLRYIFFGTGDGKNGKSLFFKLLQHILTGACMDTISHNVIIETKSMSHLNTEIEKLDKVRIGFVSELKETYKLNDERVRQITGGDPMDLRTLQKTNATIIPTANLIAITNELPQFTPIKANIDRIKVIPFHNTFENDPDFETEMMSKTDLLFSYIVKHGKIRTNYDVCPDVMNEATKSYVSENNEDNLKEFIETKMERKDGARIKRDEFRREFNNWLDSMGYKRDTRKNTGFTKDMTRHGIKNSCSHNIYYYNGVALKTNSIFQEIEESFEE